MAQWLTIHLPMQRTYVQFPHQGTKIPHATGQLEPLAAMKSQWSQNKLSLKKNTGKNVNSFQECHQCLFSTKQPCMRAESCPTL